MSNLNQRRDLKLLCFHSLINLVRYQCMKLVNRLSEFRFWEVLSVIGIGCKLSKVFHHFLDIFDDFSMWSVPQRHSRPETLKKSGQKNSSNHKCQIK